MALELARELRSLGVTGEVIALGAAATDSTVAEEIVPLSAGTRIGGLSLLPIVVRLRRELKRQGADVVLAHGGQAALAAILATPGLRARVVWQRILEFPSTGLHFPRNIVWRRVARRVQAVVAITPRVAEEVQQLGFKGALAIEPNHRRWSRFSSLDRNACRARLRDELGINDARPMIGFVGHLVDQKRPQLAVEVLERIRDETCHLVVVGDGPLRDAVVARAHGVLADRVTMLGHRTDVPELLAAFDVLVVTSSSETMTGTVVEAQMAGCPVVSFRLDGMDTVLLDGETGAIVDVDDLDAMAQSVAKVLSDRRVRERMSERARAHGATFATEAAAERYAALLRGVARRSPRVPRVLFLMPNFGVGGAEKAVYEIVRHAEAGRFEPIVASLGPPRRPVGETVLTDIRALDIPIHDLGLQGRADRSISQLVRGSLRLRSLCRRLRVDIVDSCLFEADLVARLALLATKTRHVVHLVNTPYDASVAANARSRSGRRLRLVQRIDSTSARLTDSFVAITEAVADAARRDLRLGAAKIHVISRDVDVDRFACQPLNRNPAEPLAVLSIGRLVPQKGHAVAIEAVRLAVAAGARLRYTIVGEGPLQVELLQLVRAASLEGVVSLREPTRDVCGLHADHHLFLFPSLWEGQGNALIEAMACGRPVLVSDIPALREVVGDAGIFAKPADARAFASALQMIADWAVEPLAANGAALRSRAETNYAAPVQSRRLGELYRSVARLAAERPETLCCDETSGAVG